MTNDITTTTTGALARAGAAANDIASRRLFEDYQHRKAHNTQKRQAADLNLFSEFLKTAKIPNAPTGAQLATNPEAWRGVTWGIVSAFVQWLLKSSYAVGTVNVRLSTLKTYAKLAMQAGSIPESDYGAIRAVTGYRRKEARNIDDERDLAGIHTRRTTRAGQTTKAGQPVQNVKKSAPVIIPPEKVDLLKAQPNTPQGRRDRLIMCLLLDHGFRVGELALLTVDNFNLKAGTLTFYRPKVDKVQTHRLTADSLEAARAYLNQEAPALGTIWRKSKKSGGELLEPGLSVRALTERVKYLAAAVGLSGMSAHDCRHSWASRAGRKTDPFSLQEAGGWNSLAMPRHYIELAKIANEGVKL